MSLPRWVDAAEDAEATDSGSELGDLHEQDQIDGNAVLNALQGDISLDTDADDEPTVHQQKPQKISIKLNDTDKVVQCHVCGKPGHRSGFVGGQYVDCINKPCYLCGATGHSTSTCPHRFAPEAGCTAAADVANISIVQHLCKREQGGSRIAGGYSLAPNPGSNWVVDAAVLKLHNRRCTCLEFHPFQNNLVFSGDKHGQIAVWDFDKVFERTVYTDMNKWLTNGLRFMPGSESQLATTSYDGTTKIIDCEIGTTLRTLVNANPLVGWENVEEEDKKGNWVTFIGLDVMENRTVVAGDSHGKVYFLDPRMEQPAAVLQAHKKKSKVQSISVNPVADFLVLSAGNDYQARLLDARCLGGNSNGAGESNTTSSRTFGPCVAEVTSFSHPRVINAAYFSPITGRKILTTAQDNRIRVWDNFASLDQDPSREIVHSHTFNRHLTAFKAEWDPKDANERLAVIGRYISEDFNGTPLHPIDMIDTATGATVTSLADPNLTTICPVNKPHPRRELIVTGSSRSLYAWKPEEVEEEDDGNRVEERGVSAARDAGAAGTSNGGGGVGSSSFFPRGSSNFMFFDADNASGKTKRKNSKLETPAPVGEGSKTKQYKKTEEEEEDSGDDER